MSLLLSWNNDVVAHILSDGYSVSPDGRVVSTTTKKFFRTAAGHIVGACGFYHLCAGLERRFLSSGSDFLVLEEAVAAFVREENQKNRPTADSKPLAAIVVGFDASAGRIRSANIYTDGHAVFSRPGTPAVHWLTAAQQDDPLMARVAQSVWNTSPEHVPAKMREGAEVLFDKFKGRMGGQIFEMALSPGDAPPVAPPQGPAGPRGFAVWRY